MTWEAQAREIAANAAEIGTDAALISAAAWRARVDPRATHGLTRAALALWASRESLVRGGGRPLPHDRELIARAEDLQTDASTWLQRARALSAQVSGALDAARRDTRAAASAVKAARDSQERAAAAAVLAEAQRRIGDCEAALEIAEDTGQRLAHACACLVRVPEDLAETYEAAYAHVHRGGTLPYDGDFLTGARR